MCLSYAFWKSLQKMLHFNVILRFLACCYSSFLLFYSFKEFKMCSAYSVPCLQKIRFSSTQQVFKGSVMPVGLWSLWCFPSNTGELSLDSLNSLNNFITNFVTFITDTNTNYYKKNYFYFLFVPDKRSCAIVGKISRVINYANPGVFTSLIKILLHHGSGNN